VIVCSTLYIFVVQKDTVHREERFGVSVRHVIRDLVLCLVILNLGEYINNLVSMGTYQYTIHSDHM